MSLIYNPNDVFLVQRNATSSSFVEKVLSSSPNSLVFFDSASLVTSLSTSSFTASWASGSVTSILAHTASYLPVGTYQISASQAVSASWASVAVSASWSSASYTASFLPNNTYQITASQAVSTSLALNLLNYPTNVTQSVSVYVSASNYIILQRSTASLLSAFYDYTVVSSSNARSGQITSVWNAATIIYSDTSTSDIGDTSDCYVFTQLTNDTCSLIAYTSSSLSWSISARGRYL